MFPKVYFTPAFFTEVYWEPVSGWVPPVPTGYVILFLED